MNEVPVSQDAPQDLEQDVTPSNIFIPPTVDTPKLLSGNTYSYFSPIPSAIASDLSTECVIGIDEAGRGPVLGPMVYSLFYVPQSLHYSLLRDTHAFTDSKALTAEVRSNLMRTLCTPPATSAGAESNDADDAADAGEAESASLQTHCGFSATLLSATSISSYMLPSPRTAPYNLNAQAMDATIDLIQRTYDMGLNITDIFVDTIGKPEVYQKNLERIFPAARISVEKKADVTYPVVGAASVVAKVTRDVALEVLWDEYVKHTSMTDPGDHWGSGYPSDGRATNWLKASMDPIFGWGSECRFSWGTAKDLLEGKSAAAIVDYEEEDSKTVKMTDFFSSNGEDDGAEDELGRWYGRNLSEEVF
ncbi:ribonuclease H-like protein [Eremomyces bilateralis CBS 781.70]|uniref:Ribonuclease n=1 Tax=Eremomyces bilateralis CBS 781.70 TaxID=1392243 RepID=A0A6G1G9Q7_9PEZI|nr:ribonuclease H-like protein [Eremomyces bilateralis CBS 781.70]KAF1814640.1 ribonuclease H-like protein [Eremomyces bilateralis CBS 781.70]